LTTRAKRHLSLAYERAERLFADSGLQHGDAPFEARNLFAQALLREQVASSALWPPSPTSTL